MNLLILGGTADGRKLATSLHQQGVSVIYSVAGLVRMPDVDCQVVSGGFSQFGGLISYIKQQSITAILDVTHPYAQIMSATAVDVAKACDIPCWRFHRAAWQPEAGDNWQLFQQWDKLSKV
ncbi:MAG: precorrin-6A/cobalt-precorrin-6A reductase, partial [Oceanicoccus sp.]